MMPNYALSTCFTVLQAEDICKELSIDQCQEGKAFHTTVLFKARVSLGLYKNKLWMNLCFVCPSWLISA